MCIRDRLNIDSNWSGPRKELQPRLEINGRSATVTCRHEAVADPPDFIQYIWIKNDDNESIVAAKEFFPTTKGFPELKCSVNPGTTYSAAAYSNLHGLWIGRSETA